MYVCVCVCVCVYVENIYHVSNQISNKHLTNDAIQSLCSYCDPSHRACVSMLFFWFVLLYYRFGELFCFSLFLH